MRLTPLVLIAVIARVSAGQVVDTAHPIPGATVSGVVRDSIAHAPLAGAMVQLVGADSGTRFGRTVASDALGRYALTNLPDSALDEVTLGLLIHGLVLLIFPS